MSEEAQQLPKEALPHVEFETKYKSSIDAMLTFKEIAEAQADLRKFVYVEGPDIYYWKDGMRKRHRRPSHNFEGGRAEVTLKLKPKGAWNNVQRKEFNWRVDGTPTEVIHESLLAEGYEHEFTVWKTCHIYIYDDATIVFYSLADTTDGPRRGKYDHYIEIEANEDKMHETTAEQAWSVIRKYEKLLEPAGVNAQKRMDRSLPEIYGRKK